jgi:aminoglycoside phosphotransferase (APT) family kinase protein
VRFVKLDDHVIAIKETLFDLAKREYEMLRDLEKLEIPCVEPFAIVSGRKTEDGEELPAVLITRHLKYSLPYRAMWSQGIKEQTAKRLVDALALLLVRLHLIGFFWGDVSLSNTCVFGGC